MAPEILPRALPQSFRVTTKSFLFDDVPKTLDFFLPRLLPRSFRGKPAAAVVAAAAAGMALTQLDAPLMARALVASAILPRNLPRSFRGKSAPGIPQTGPYGTI